MGGAGEGVLVLQDELDVVEVVLGLGGGGLERVDGQLARVEDGDARVGAGTDRRWVRKLS